MSVSILVSSLFKLIRESRGIIVIGSWGYTVFVRGTGSCSVILKARYSYYRAIPRLGTGKATML